MKPTRRPASRSPIRSSSPRRCCSPAPATVANALGTAVSSWRRKHSADDLQHVELRLSMWAGESGLFWPVPPLTYWRRQSVADVPLLAFSAVHYLINSPRGRPSGRRPQVAVCGVAEHFVAVGEFISQRRRSHSVWSYDTRRASRRRLLVLLLIVLHLTLRSFTGASTMRQDRISIACICRRSKRAMAIDAKDDVTHSHVRRVQAHASVWRPGDR